MGRAGIERLVAQPEIDAEINALRALQAEFIDLNASSFFFASEELDQAPG